MLTLTPEARETAYEDVYAAAGAYTDVEWETAGSDAWDRLGMIASEYVRGEYDWDEARRLIAEVRAEVVIGNRTPIAADASVSPLDLLVGDVVVCDAGTILIDHIISWDADKDADHNRPWAAGYRPERVAAASGRVIRTFPGGPAARWTVQGNRLRRLSHVYR